MTLRDILTEASTRIARRDAETLLAHFLARDRAWLFAHPEAELSALHSDAFRIIVTRRSGHEPVQYLTGVQDFYGLLLRVTRDTLIPRPETELLVEAVLHWIAANPHIQSPRILDVGTGSGAIAIALAKHLPTADITATDISRAVLEVARDNSARLRVNKGIHFQFSDLLEAPQFHTAKPFDVIVSNPPYIPTAEAANLQPEVVNHEPHAALFAGADGLDIYRRLIPQARAALRPNGLLALEFGFGQREPLQSLLVNSTGGDWHNVQFLDDYAGIPRVALATRPDDPATKSRQHEQTVTVT